MFGGYVYETEKIVDDYERHAEAQRYQHRRQAERVLVGTAIAVILKRARDRRRQG